MNYEASFTRTNRDGLQEVYLIYLNDPDPKKAHVKVQEKFDLALGGDGTGLVLEKIIEIQKI